MNAWLHEYGPAAAVLAAATVGITAVDLYAARSDPSKGKVATVSRTLSTPLDHPAGAVLVVGGLAGLGWHLVADPIVRRLAARVAEEV